MRLPLRSEQGYTLVTAIVLMTVMLGIGLATVSLVDTQSTESRATRQRDTAFNLAEAALTAQVYELALRWPGAGYAVNPAYANYACTPASLEPVLNGDPPATAQLMCPSASTLSPLVSNVDAQGATWETHVYDDATSTGNPADRGRFYSDALVNSGDAAPSGGYATTPRAGYDSNRNGQVWVKSSATAKGRTRTLVSLVKAQFLQQDVINSALLAGSLTFSNQGRHSGFFIEQRLAADPNGNANIVTVRCDPAAQPTLPCLGYPANSTGWQDKLGGAIDPPSYNPAPTAPNALEPATLDALMADAKADGTYYSAAPGGLTCADVNRPPTTFHVLYIKDCNISWSGNDVLNTEALPGMVILDNSRLTLLGKTTINGVLYARNPPPPVTEPVVKVHGCAQIAGGLIIDDMGATDVGSCSQKDRPNIKFTPTAYSSVKTYASAGIIQNTWRELTAR
jgi:Tfp pilus assembly protein PilX